MKIEEGIAKPDGVIPTVESDDDVPDIFSDAV